MSGGPAGPGGDPAQPPPAPALGMCREGYKAPEYYARINPKGYLVEESGIAPGRVNPDLVWSHNDNYGAKHVFAVSPETGNVVKVLDLGGLPGIGHHTDFEDIAVSRCPHQEGRPEAEQEWCLFIGDVGNNVGQKNLHVYAVKEPVVPGGAKAPVNVRPQRVSARDAMVFRLLYEKKDPWEHKPPNVEALVAPVDGSRVFLIEKTYSRGGNGPAGVWESPFLGSLHNNHGQGFVTNRRCTRRSPTSSWDCRDEEAYAASRLEPTLSDVLETGREGEDPGQSDEGGEAPPVTRQSKDGPGGTTQLGNPPDGVCRGSEKVPDDSTCEERKAWGNCGEGWMVQGGYCDETCGRCRRNALPRPEDLPPPMSICPPHGERVPRGGSCQKRREWGNCDEDWMVEKNYCAETCGRCRREGEALPTCTGREREPRGSSCAQQKEWGKCGAEWLLQKNFCEETCGRCSGRRNVVRSFDGVSKQAGGPGSIWTNSETDILMHTLHVKIVHRLQNPFPKCDRFDEFELMASVFPLPESVVEPRSLEAAQEAEAEDEESDGTELPLCPGAEESGGGHSCSQQKRWGKCDEAWLIEKGLCGETCGRCRRNKKAAMLARERAFPFADRWEEWSEVALEYLEELCGDERPGLRNTRNIAAADLHDSGHRLLIATYGGIFEYYLPVANDLREIQFMRQVSTTNRDGSNHYSQRGRFWAGQEGVAYDRRANGAGTANDIWSVSETHQHLFHLECNAI